MSQFADSSSPSAAPLSQVGVYGLGVMGQSLARNIASRGFAVSVSNRSPAAVAEFMERYGDEGDLRGHERLEGFVASLATPRRVILMVKAGQAVDDTVRLLRPLLDEGDLIVDAGNSWYEDSQRRARELEAQGLRFLGLGVSGGEEGALKGPSLMPGGSLEAYELLHDVLDAIAARVDEEPCSAYLGKGGAGHFVKMVHNGIEYGDMQLIAEVYQILRELGGLDPDAIAAVFERWNQGPLASYLVEITATVLRKRDEASGAPLLDVILDRAGQKGTGRWTAHVGLELGVPIPTIEAALQGRVLSSFKDERVRAAAHLRGPEPGPRPDSAALVADLEAALLASKISAYAQGMALLRTASREHGWDLRLDEVAALWRGGCIIRAGLLRDVRAAFVAQPDLENLMLSEAFSSQLAAAQAGWRRVVAQAVGAGLAVPGLAASLSYYDGYRTARGPAALIQGQRDLFGAHTYERTDQPGTFHTDWS